METANTERNSPYRLCHRRNANKLVLTPFVPPCATVKRHRGTPIIQ